jgi:hypothetical protein
MHTAMTSALFNELEKIAQEAKTEPHWAKSVAKGALGVGLGAGLGTGAAMLVEKAAPQVFLQKHPNVAPAMKIILPILGATTSYVQQRLRHRVDEEYKKAPGLQEET